MAAQRISRPRSTRRRTEASSAGFTLIEVVVALALVTVVLAAIGSVIAVAATGTRTLEQRVALIQTARMIATDVPRRDQLGTGDIAGELFGHRWQVRSLPFSADGPAGANVSYIPYLVEMRIQSPSGVILSLETIRLQKKRRQ